MQEPASIGNTRFATNRERVILLRNAAPGRSVTSTLPRLQLAFATQTAALDPRLGACAFCREDSSFARKRLQ